METRWRAPCRWLLVLVLANICFCKEDSDASKDSSKDEKDKEAPKKTTTEAPEGSCSSNSQGGKYCSWPCMPGDACYYTKLLGLGFSEGTLVKTGDFKSKGIKDKHNFDPDWMDYMLTIKSGKSKELLVTPMLDVHKYDLLYKPKLIWLGKEQEYSPIQNIEFPLKLDENSKGTDQSPGPLDRMVTLKVSDPEAKGGLFGGANEHEYKIQVSQAPDIESIVTASDIKVVGIRGDGHEEPAEYTTFDGKKGKYNASSTHNEIRYVVGEKVKTVRVTVSCPQESTGLKYNGQSCPGIGCPGDGQSYTSQEFEGATKSILGQCLYKHDEFTKGQEMQRTYVITVARTADITSTTVDLRMWPPAQRGGCVAHHEEGKKPGWKCMRAPPDAQFVGSYDNPKAELVVHNKKTGGRYRLWNGIPTSIPVPENNKQDELVLEAGNNQKEYTFQFGPPPNCNTMHWTGPEVVQGPKNSSLHKYWQPHSEIWKQYQDNPLKSWKCSMIASTDKSNKALVPQEVNNVSKYCDWEPCTIPVDNVCCTRVRPPCGSYDSALYGVMNCPGNEIFHPERRCAEYPCQHSDMKRNYKTGAEGCCYQKMQGAAAPCASMACAVDSVLVRDAAELTCIGNPCQPHDAKTCCTKRAICNSMKCPPGFSQKYNAALYLCVGLECLITDRDTCCDAAAYCDEFKCPGPSGAKTTGGAMFASPLGWTPKPDAATIPCGGDPCIEWDTGICCNKVGYCATQTCKSGYYLRDHAETIACDGGAGKKQCDMAHDLDTCCAPAAMCHSYVCPLGYDYKIGSRFISCPSAKCKDSDRSLCCDMTNPFEAAQDTTMLFADEGEIRGCQDSHCNCEMLEGPLHWKCQATGEKLHLTVNYTFDQPVGNKVSMEGKDLMVGKSVTVPLPAISVSRDMNPVHATVHARAFGRGQVVHKILISVVPPSSGLPEEKESKQKESSEKESIKKEDNGDEESTSKSSKENGSTIKENALRQLAQVDRQLSEKVFVT